MTLAIVITICALVILLGLEIRHREVSEELTNLRIKANILDEEVQKLKAEIKLKKNIYDEYIPPK